MLKFKLKLNIFVIVIVAGSSACVLAEVGRNPFDDSVITLMAINKNDEPSAPLAQQASVGEDDLLRKEQEGYALLLAMLEQPFVKSFREYCEDLIALWSDIPKFKGLCEVLAKLKHAKDPKELKSALAPFAHLFPKDLQDRLDKMSLMQQFALKKRLQAAMNKK